MNICGLLIGNKADLEDQRQVSKNFAEKFCEESKMIFLETSIYAEDLMKNFTDYIKVVLKKQ